MATPDISILLGLEGGFSISSGSGKLIRNQIEGIIRQTQNQVKLQLQINEAGLQQQIKDAIEKMPPVKIPVDTSGGGSSSGNGGKGGGVNEIQKIGSLIAEVNRKKAQLLDFSTSSQQYQTISSQISALRKKYVTEVSKYSQQSGKTPTQIKNEVNALNSVAKSADAYALKVAKINDTYEKLKSTIGRVKVEQETAFGNNKKSYSNSADKDIQAKWSQYEKLYLDIQKKAKNVLGGSFNAGDSNAQVQQLQDIIGKYNELNQLLQTISSTSSQNAKTNENGTRAVAKYAQNVYDFYKQIKDTAPADLTQKSLDIFTKAATGGYGKDINQLIDDFTQLRNEVYKSQSDIETFGQKIARVFKQKLGYGIMAAAAMQARKALQQLYTNVVEMDKAMTQLRIVTNETDVAYSRFASNAVREAKSIGASVTDIMKSAETYARLGYTLNESLNLSTTTAQLANVAATDANTATTFMTAILKGFNKTASDAEGIGDILTLVGKKYAISAEELGSALERGGASMYAANNTLEESVALLAAG